MAYCATPLDLGSGRRRQGRSSGATTTCVTELDHCNYGSQAKISGSEEKRNMGQWSSLLGQLALASFTQIRRNCGQMCMVHNPDIQILPVTSANENIEPSNTEKHADLSHNTHGHRNTDTTNTSYVTTSGRMSRPSVWLVLKKSHGRVRVYCRGPLKPSCCYPLSQRHRLLDDT